MTLGGWFLGVIMTGATIFGVYCGNTGILMPAPTKEALSVKEGSLHRPGTVSTGYFSNRRFVGGGFRGGK